MNVYLVGYRGTGKTTVAPLVANLLGDGWAWIDMDERIEQTAGQSIADLFATRGESCFRDHESSVLSGIANLDQQVAATGGGVVMREENRQRLALGHVVWLTGLPDTLWRRLQLDASTASRRPNLTPQGGIEEIERMLAAREPWYRSLAHQTLSTDSLTPSELADRIVTELRRQRSRGAS